MTERKATVLYALWISAAVGLASGALGGYLATRTHAERSGKLTVEDVAEDVDGLRQFVRENLERDRDRIGALERR